MRAKANSKGAFIILITLLIAMLMEIMPLPNALNLLKPDWVAMVMIYWVMALPNRVGVLTGWTVGLVLDVLKGSLLGINAVSLAIVAFLIQMLYHRLRLFPRWKQAINITVIVGIHRLLVVNISGLVVTNNTDYTYWLPLISVAVFWPWVFIILRDLRRKHC